MSRAKTPVVHARGASAACNTRCVGGKNEKERSSRRQAIFSSRAAPQTTRSARRAPQAQRHMVCCFGLCGGSNEEEVVEQGDNWAVLDTKRVWQPTDGAMTVTRTRAAGVGQVFAEQTVLQVPHPTPAHARECRPPYHTTLAPAFSRLAAGPRLLGGHRREACGSVRAGGRRRRAHARQGRAAWRQRGELGAHCERHADAAGGRRARRMARPRRLPCDPPLCAQRGADPCDGVPLAVGRGAAGGAAGRGGGALLDRHRQPPARATIPCSPRSSAPPPFARPSPNRRRLPCTQLAINFGAVPFKHKPKQGFDGVIKSRSII